MLMAGQLSSLLLPHLSRILLHFSDSWCVLPFQQRSEARGARMVLSPSWGFQLILALPYLHLSSLLRCLFCRHKAPALGTKATSLQRLCTQLIMQYQRPSQIPLQRWKKFCFFWYSPSSFRGSRDRTQAEQAHGRWLHVLRWPLLLI